MEVFKEFTFDAAHFLPHVPEEHKCRRMHGHTYRVRLYISGQLHPKLGWVIDFGDIKTVWKPLEKQLDHHVLNEIEGLENPTAENIAIWLWRRIKPDIPYLSKIMVRENPTNGVIYQGEFEE